MVPMIYPETSWANNNKGLPITILNSGSHFNTSTNDWSDAMQWLRENTPEDAVVHHGGIMGTGLALLLREKL